MIAILSGAALTGGRLRDKWQLVATSPAARYLPEVPASVAPGSSSSEPWITVARDRLSELAGLAPGWDGGHARAISPGYISGALRFLASDLVADLATKPDVVPTFGGGLFIEWHTEAVDLIIEIGPGGASFYVCDNETDHEVEAALGDHIEDLIRAFVKLGLGQ
jgi:hypothetical protein